MDAKSGLRVVLVHDWLTGMRGGEKCLEVACKRWPDAPLFTLLHCPGAVSREIEARQIQTSPLQFLPRVEHYYRYLLPLMPRAAARWRIPDCDLLVSFSHCVAKSARAPADATHVCYCFTPMRYAWHLREAYFGSGRARVRDAMLERLRRWDRDTAQRVTHFVAISRTVQERIASCYGRQSTVIYPPVDTDFYSPAPVAREDYYLVVSAAAPYKRLDLAVTTCTRLGRRLVVIGTGQDARRLRQLAGPTVRLLGWQPAAVIRHHFRRCRALLFPGEEDFGIVPVEAQACGAPVIAFGSGGLTETVIPHGRGQAATGLWFEEQTPDCLAAAIDEFERVGDHFDPAVARQQAQRFNQQRFAAELFAYLDGVVQPARAPARRAA
jgi:glycosyltransferase involved in cell wall biosynthesis